MIVGCMGSLKEREELLKDVLEHVLPQVDVLHVCLNGYKTVPKWLSEAKWKNIHISIDPNNTYTTATKFRWVNEYENVYYICFDDDLIYPPDYVARMVAKMDKHGKEHVVTVHFCALKKDFESWPKDIVAVHYGGRLKCDANENDMQSLYETRKNMIPGTATVGFYLGKQEIDMGFFAGFPMTDLRFAYYFHKVWKMGSIGIARDRNWIRMHPDMVKSPQAWEGMLHDKERQRIATDFCKEFLL